MKKEPTKEIRVSDIFEYRRLKPYFNKLVSIIFFKEFSTLDRNLLEKALKSFDSKTDKDYWQTLNKFTSEFDIAPTINKYPHLSGEIDGRVGYIYGCYLLTAYAFKNFKNLSIEEAIEKANTEKPISEVRGYCKTLAMSYLKQLGLKFGSEKAEREFNLEVSDINMIDIQTEAVKLGKKIERFEKMELRKLDGKELRLKEGDEFTVVYKDKEIERKRDILGDAYAAKVEKEIGMPLKTCINCAYFEFTPLSINMGDAYKGKCDFWEKELEGKSLPKDYHFSIFHLCEHFKFVPLKERIEYMRKNIGAFSKALGGESK